MVYWFENEATWAIYHRSNSFPGAASQLLFTSELSQEKWRSLLSEDEMAVFLTKTERKESKNTQNILDVDGCYLLF